MASTFACWSSFTIESDCDFEDSLGEGAGCTIDVLGEDGADEDGEEEDGEDEDEEDEDEEGED